MELFTPEIGLMIWMLFCFLVVFAILAKFAWPAILKGVGKRADYIDQSVKSAKEANERLSGIKAEADKILSQAREEQLRLLKEGTESRDKLIKKAHDDAAIEADKVMSEAKLAIEREKDNAIRDIRNQVASMSLEIAEKVLRKNLEDKNSQMELIQKLIDEAFVSKS